MLKTEDSSATSMPPFFFRTAWRHILQDRNLDTHYPENFISHWDADDLGLRSTWLDHLACADSPQTPAVGDSVTKDHIRVTPGTSFSCRPISLHCVTAYLLKNETLNPLTLWRRNYFLILAHPVYKMWIMQEPKKLALWNKLHFEEKKPEIIEHV